MASSLMYSDDDAYVLLEPNQPEQLLTSAELLDKLKGILLLRQNDLPRDLQKFADVESQAKHLMETCCELDGEPEHYLQWYVVRLEKD